jgi:DNA gyrase/topoisomerase IV subunit A
MKLTEKEKEQILKNWAEAMSKIIERMSIEMWELEEENKKLNEKVRFLEECLDRKEKLNEKYRKEIEELKETLEHRDSVLSIMYDLLRSDLGDYEQLCMIDVVIDVEVWNEPQNKLREELLDRFWKRDF